MLKTFSITNVGMKRTLNQDYLFSSEEPVGCLPNLFIVADGMGGHKAGDYASRLATTTVVERIGKSEEGEPKEVLGEAIAIANELVRKKAAELPEMDGMGTTIVAATCIGQKLLVANVGDSRLYIINGRKIRQITRDHSWVEEMVRRGEISREAARIHPDKNIITRAIGAEDTVNVDFFCETLQEDDVILMCTDGLTNMLEDDEIVRILEKSRDVVEKAEELVNGANEKGGKDNISVILIEGLVPEVKGA